LFLDDDREISLDTQTLTLEQPQINITADSGRQNNRTRPIHRNLYDQREVQNVPTTSSGDKNYFIAFLNYLEIFISLFSILKNIWMCIHTHTRARTLYIYIYIYYIHNYMSDVQMDTVQLPTNHS